ncbi:MAG TPA: hypothetical protein VK907_14490, partial [Phnomibacter sp.]|nr:hypothetical protein [Phnomibacter sp.]
MWEEQVSSPKDILVSLLKMKMLFFPFFIVLTLLPDQGFAQPYGNEWIDFNKTYFKFPVREQRFYRIPLSTLNAAGLGTIPAEQFQLWRDGQEVPIYTSATSGPLPANGFIEFFGKPNTGFLDSELYLDKQAHTNPNRSFFGDTAWYFLTINPMGNNKRFVDVMPKGNGSS